MSTVTTLESHWARYVVGLPHALCMLTPQAALECALEAMYVQPGDTVLVVGDAAPRVVAAVDRVGAAAVQCTSLADCEADAEGAVGVVYCHATEGGALWYDGLVALCMRRGLWIIEDCGVRLDVGRASHVAVWALVGGIAACLDDGVAARMTAIRARDGWGMSEEDAVRCVEALRRLRGEARTARVVLE